ncbi:MAG: TonB-dependent receptor plug domain-containing protein [Nitrospinales bacterium]
MANVASDFFEMELVQLMDQDVITPSKTIQKISDAPGTVIVVTQQQIRERGYLNLVDLLEDLPGIDIQRQTAPNPFNRIAIRGITGNNKFIILQNGFRISGPTGENIAIDNNFPLYHAQRVEIIYGPVSALYGADAFAGIINLITQKAEKIDGAEVSSSFGTDEFYYNYLKFGKALTSKIDLTVGGHWQASGNPDLSETYPGLYQGFQGDLLNPNGSVFKTAAARGDSFLGKTESYTVNLELDYLKKFNIGYTRSILRHPSTVNQKPENALFTKGSEIKTLLETYHGKYKFEINPPLSGITSIDYSHYTLLPETKFTNDVGGFNAFKYAEGKKLKIEQQLNYEINAKNQLVGGIIFENFDALPRTTDLPKKFDPGKDPNEQGFFYPNTDIPILFFDVNYQNYGAYIQAQSKWTDWFSTTLGTRFDYDSRFGETFNPRVGAIIKPRQDTTFELLYSEAFLSPSPQESFTHFGSFSGFKNADGQFETFFFFIPNPDLKPEKSRTVEINATHNVTHDLIVSVSGYYTEVDDIIETVRLNEPSFIIPGAKILAPRRFENVGNATIWGADLRIDYQRSFDNYNFKIWGNYSWLKGDVVTGDGTSEPLLVARNKIKMGFTLKYLEKYFITPRLRWVGKTPIFPASSFKETDSYTVLHLHAGINNIYKNLSAFIDIRNLADVQYFNAGNGNRRDFDFSPQNPRRIVVGLRYDL